MRLVFILVYVVAAVVAKRHSQHPPGTLLPTTSRNVLQKPLKRFGIEINWHLKGPGEGKNQMRTQVQLRNTKRPQGQPVGAPTTKKLDSNKESSHKATIPPKVNKTETNKPSTTAQQPSKPLNIEDLLIGRNLVDSSGLVGVGGVVDASGQIININSTLLETRGLFAATQNIDAFKTDSMKLHTKVEFNDTEEAAGSSFDPAIAPLDDYSVHFYFFTPPKEEPEDLELMRQLRTVLKRSHGLDIVYGRKI